MKASKKFKGLIIPKNGKPGVVLDYKDLKRSAHVLRAVNHPLRQKMMELIRREGGVHVTRLYIKLRLEQSVASQHLAILRRAGFVKTKRSGKFILYAIDRGRVSQIARMVHRISV